MQIDQDHVSSAVVLEFIDQYTEIAKPHLRKDDIDNKYGPISVKRLLISIGLQETFNRSPKLYELTFYNNSSYQGADKAQYIEVLQLTREIIGDYNLKISQYSQTT